MTNKFNELELYVNLWAVEKGINKYENRFVQMLKCVSEVGELSDALIKDNELEIKDGIGDVLVTLIILSQQLKLDLTECLEHAYNEIKNRQGKNINGSFVKEVQE